MIEWYTDETTVGRKIDARGRQDSQGTCRGIEQVLVDTQRAPRHASYRSWITPLSALLASAASRRYDRCANYFPRSRQYSISPRTYTSCDAQESVRLDANHIESNILHMPLNELRTKGCQEWDIHGLQESHNILKEHTHGLSAYASSAYTPIISIAAPIVFARGMSGRQTQSSFGIFIA